ncbi:hypothetical protein Tco_1467384 [Tanacetum coccineum]
MSTLKFAETYNLVVFLDKSKESEGFEQIIDFLNASSIRYALTVNPTIYTTCIEQFWAIAKVKTVNGERQIQALVDKKRVIITETSIRSDLKLEDAEGTNYLPTATHALRAQEKRIKPPTKAQKRNTMSTYLKNMTGYKHNQPKSKSYDEIQEMFDKEMKRVNTFVDMNAKLVKGSKTKAEGSFKRAGDELESDKSKKQKIDEHVEAEKDDDQEEAELKKHIEIVKDDEVAIYAIPLATKPPMIVEYKIVKEGKFGYFQLIRSDKSSKRYLSVIKMLQNIDREDLETLWKLVKAKHGNTRPEEDYKSIIWGDLKEMFDKEMKRVNTFVDMNAELVKGSKTKAEGSSKREGDELEYDKSKKQKIDEHVEAEKDDD